MPLTARRVALAAAAGALAPALAVAVATVVGAQEHRQGHALLPGTTVAGVDVGDMPVHDAADAVTAALDERVDQAIEVTAADAAATTTPRELGADPEALPALAGEAVGAAVESTRAAGWADLARAHWTDHRVGVTVPVDLDVDGERVAAVVDDLADEVDRPREDATATWAGDGVDVEADVTGREVDAEAGAAAVAEAAARGDDRVELPVGEREADLTGAELLAAADLLEAAGRATVERTLEAHADGETWQVPAADLDAVPDLDAVAAEAAELAAEGADAEEAVAQLAPVPADGDARGAAQALAEEVAVAPVDAALDYDDGWIDIVPSQEGRALDVDAAADALAAALADGAAEVELPVEAVSPQRTTDAYDDVLLLRQGERRLYHYVDGEIADDWPVAVGTNDSPTPTGEFTVGAKRHMPTWYNPAPDGWGADMPEVVGPGPDNPLGVRALNWNRGGRDTLIRFHGTPEAHTVGTAASNGCVRMYNQDVIDLYDRVPSGTTIVSVWG